MIQIEFSKQEVEALFKEKASNPNGEVRRKAEVLYLKSLNFSHTAIQEAVRVSRTTLASYLKSYKKEGLKWVLTNNHYIPKSELEKHEPKIKEYFEKYPPMSANEAAAKIKELTSISRSPTQVRAFLKKVGMKTRKAGFVPGGQNIEKKIDEQAEFLKTRLKPLIGQAEAGKIKLYFVDAAHFVMQPYLGYFWCFVRCFILSPSGRKRYNVLGALDYAKNKLISVCNDAYINALSVCELLKKLSKSNKGLPVKIVLDNAPYQRCKKVEMCAKSLGIELVFLPAYSPQLNLIERFWKFLKKKCLYSKYYENFQVFKEAIDEFIENLDKYKKELKTLLTPNFQTFENVNIVTV